MNYERTDTNFWSRLHVARRRPKKSYAASVTRSLCAFGMSPACIMVDVRKTRAGWDRVTSERRAMTVAEDRQVPVSRREARSARRMRHFRQAHDRLVITPTELRTLSSVVELCTYAVTHVPAQLYAKVPSSTLGGTISFMWLIRRSS